MRNDMEIQAMIGNLKNQKMSSKIRAGVEEMIRNLQVHNDEFQVERLAIEKNDLLTKKGKAVEIQDLGDATLSYVKPYRGIYEELIAESERELFNNPNAEEKSSTAIIVEELRQNEIRRMYKVETLDPLQIESHISNPGFLEAVLSSPKPLLPDNRIKELLREKAAKDQPVVADYLKQYDLAQGLVDALIRAIESDVGASGWKDPEDPLNQKLEPAVDQIKEMASNPG
jgi:hypothetical protein